MTAFDDQPGPFMLIRISNNTALPMFVLSEHYVTATTEVQRATVAAAGEAMLARGGDFTFGSLIGFLLPSIAQIVMAFVMLRSGIFSIVTASTGLAGFTCLLRNGLKSILPR